jgi:hypothetical protein
MGSEEDFVSTKVVIQEAFLMSNQREEQVLTYSELFSERGALWKSAVCR